LDGWAVQEKIMDFKTVNIIQHPIDRVWAAMRDDLPKLVVEDIESINVELYEKRSHLCTVVNIWKACPRLPDSIARHMDSDMFVWTDRAEWNEKKMECLWSIEPHHFRERIRCGGSTKFDSAIGGRGTRVTFSGNFEWNNQNLPGEPNVLEEAVYKGIEALIRNLIPKNFRKITDALTKYLDANRGG
jgi:hypothetical protein